MKKRFISVAAFCALLAAPVFVGCSDDYDDDITNLQSQIDELKGSAVTVEEAQAAITEAVNALKEELNTAIGNKANNADVIALQEKVSELSDALNGNADDQTVTGLVEQVQELAARVNEIEDTSLAELEKQLTEGLADLRAAYEAADDALEASLANKAEADAVTTLQGQMTTVQGDLQGALADLATLKADGDATALLNYGFSTYTLKTVVPESALPPIPVSLGTQATVQPVLGEDTHLLLEKAQAGDLRQTVSLPESLEAPVAAGSQIGTLTVTAGEEIVAELPILAGEEIPRVTFGQMLARILRMAFLSA